MPQLLETYSAFKFYFAFLSCFLAASVAYQGVLDEHMCKKTTLNFFHLTVKIDLVEVDYYLKHVFHMLYYKNVTPAEALFHFSFIS